MRVVSLLPSATEITCALGLQGSLVGVSHECDWPSTVKALPRLTRSILPHGLSSAEIDAAVSAAVREGRALYAVDGPLLASLAPDLVLTQGLCEVCAVGPDTVASALQPLPEALPPEARVISLCGQSLEGVLHDIVTVGEATGATGPAQALSVALRRRWEELAASTPAQRPSAVALEWTDPPFYGGHWVPEQLAVAGFTDLLGQEGVASGRATWEQILALDPSFILVMACGFNLEENLELGRKLLTHPVARELRALRDGGLWALDANSCFSRPGPRLVRGAEVLRAIATGQTPDPRAATRIR